MSTEPEIRPLRQADLPGLVRLLQQTWPGWYGPGGPGAARDDLAARMGEDSLPIGRVAVLAGAVVGHGALTATSHGAAGVEGPWIGGLVTRPGARGRGVASALVAALEICAQQRGAARILATTGAAAGLLERRGWTLLRRLDPHEAVYERKLAVQAGPPVPPGPA